MQWGLPDPRNSMVPAPEFETLEDRQVAKQADNHLDVKIVGKHVIESVEGQVLDSRE
jgi:hypothetical protein